MKESSRHQQKEVVKNFKDKKILVIGDIMIDEYIFGDVERLSPEAPVPIFDVKEKIYSLGGAGNVAQNIKTLGGIPILVGVIGNDIEGERIKFIMEKENMMIDGIIIDENRPTTVKTRIIANKYSQQMIRIDREKREKIEKKIKNMMLDFISSVDFDAILFEDYDKGVLDSEIIKNIITKYNNKIITADPKFDNFFEYQCVTLFKPNRKEVEFAMHIKLDENNILSVCKELQKRINCKNILLTLGKDGVFVLEEDGKNYKIKTKAKEVFDETGAGDTVIATATLALVACADMWTCAYLANIAGGIEVGKLGAVPVTYEELLNSL